MNALEHGTGIEVRNLDDMQEFAARQTHERAVEKQLVALQRIARVFVEAPERMLQELVNVAAELCDADSSGVSLETKDAAGTPVFHWAATSGQYSKYLDAMLPQVWMPCGICLDRMRPQHVKVPIAHFAAMGVDAPSVTDGMLIPWTTEGMRGTIWILAHERTEAFDRVDYGVMQTLADFAAMAVRHRVQQQALMRKAAEDGAGAMAHDLAHKINNPLQSITNSIYLAAQQTPNTHLKQASDDLRTLNVVVQELLVVEGQFKSRR